MQLFCKHFWVHNCFFFYYKLIVDLQMEVTIMGKLKIPENHSGITKTLRLPEDMVEEIQNLAILKNLSFNKTITSLLEFSLQNIDEQDKNELKKMSKNSITL